MCLSLRMWGLWGRWKNDLAQSRCSLVIHTSVLSPACTSVVMSEATAKVSVPDGWLMGSVSFTLGACHSKAPPQCKCHMLIPQTIVECLRLAIYVKLCLCPQMRRQRNSCLKLRLPDETVPVSHGGV